MNGSEETKTTERQEPHRHKKARQVNHRAGFVFRDENKLHSRQTIRASPSNDESVVDDVNVVKQFISMFQEFGPT